MVFFAYVVLIGVAIFGITTLVQSDVRNAVHVVDAAADLAIIGSATSVSIMPTGERSAQSERRLEPVQVESDAFPHARPAPMALERMNAEEFAELKKEAVERIVTDDATPWHDGDQQTFKTVCVRLCDGAYFPISFATTRGHFAKDEAQCISRCGSPARLFVFPNPGGNPEMMRDRSGRSYLALPTAFQFRQGPVAGCSCKAEPWEAASRDRHRMLAMEADVAVGKQVDTVELAALRESLAHANTEAPVGATLVEPIVIPESTATIRSEREPEAAKTTPSKMEYAALEAEGLAPSQSSVIARSGASGGVARITPPMIAPPQVETDIGQVDAGINERASGGARTETRTSVDAKTRRVKTVNRKNPKRRASRQVVAEEAMIWGFGPGAYNNHQRGTTAYDTFARNFY